MANLIPMVLSVKYYMPPNVTLHIATNEIDTKVTRI